MGLTSWVANAGSSALGYIVPFLFVLTIVVFFPAFGHFIVARWCRAEVQVFPPRFGPDPVGPHRRQGPPLRGMTGRKLGAAVEKCTPPVVLEWAGPPEDDL